MPLLYIFGKASRLVRTRFVGQVVVVAGGTAAAQLITVAFSPVVTRLYGPEAFGILGIFVAMTAFASPVATMGYGLAVVLPDSEQHARSVMRLSILTALSVSFTVLVIVLAWGDVIAGWFGFEPVSTYLLLVPLVVFFSGLEQTFRQWLVRNRRFGSISSAAVGQSAGVGSAITGIGLVTAIAPVLLAISTAGHVLHAGLLWLAARKTLRHDETLGVSVTRWPFIKGLRSVAFAYRDFPLYRAPQLLLNAVSFNTAPLILAAYFGPVSAGFYVLSRRVLALPSMLVSQSVGTVLLPRLTAAARRGENIRPAVFKATLGLALIGVVPFGMVIVFGPALFGLVFGSEWVVAGEYARWLAVWLYFHFLNAPSIQALPVLGLQRPFLVYEVVAVFVRVASLMVGALIYDSASVAVALFSVTGAVLYLVLIVWVLLRSGGQPRPDLLENGDCINSHASCD